MAASVIVLGHGCNGATNVTRVTIGGVCGNAGLGRHQVGLFEVARSLDPTDMLHVSQPDVLSGLASLDGVTNKGDNISKDYRNLESARQTHSHRFARLTHCPDEETKRGDGLGRSADCNRPLESGHPDGGGRYAQESMQLTAMPRMAAVWPPVASHMTQRKDNQETSKASLDVKAPSRMIPRMSLGGVELDSDAARGRQGDSHCGDGA